MTDSTKSEIVYGLKDLADGFEYDGEDESARLVRNAIFIIGRQAFRICEQDSEIERLKSLEACSCSHCVMCGAPKPSEKETGVG